nr:ATP-dependent DNA helicase [uncultured Acetatifactor sp.]
MEEECFREVRAGVEEPKEGSANPEEVRVSVRRLVEFILRHGDIDNRYHASPDNAMQEGGRIHRMIQRRMGAEYQAEVPLKMTFPADGYMLSVEGRADGIIRKDGSVTIDEIKGTYRDLFRIIAPMPLHVAQAKCYAYIYGSRQGLEKIGVRMTYCHMPSGEIRYFHEEYEFEKLAEWFDGLLAAYRKWSDYSWKWRAVRTDSIAGLEFPYPYREGQKELAAHVYRTIYHKKKLFLEAPTGVGKTLSTIYPAVQAMGKGMGEKVFYLTAKTITRTVAEEAVRILRDKGLRLKSVILTAKEKICFMDEAECNPECCPYARGHYDRVNDAVFDMLTSEESFDRETIAAYAEKHRVCPFEMCLDASVFADAVICDYNYLFDPHVYLKRFFGESVAGDYIFLIDEAHNLLERGREMYSAVLEKEAFVELRRELKKTIVSEKERKRRNGKKPDVSGQMSLDMALFPTAVSCADGIGGGQPDAIDQTGTVSPEAENAAQREREEGPDREIHRQLRGTGAYDEEDGTADWESRAAERHGAGNGDAGDGGEDRETQDADADGDGEAPPQAADGHYGRRSVLARQGYAEKMMYHLEKCNRELLTLKRQCEDYCLVESIEAFVEKLMRFQEVCEDYLSEQEDGQPPVRDMLLDFYFAVSHFFAIYELVDENYVKYTRLDEDGRFFLKLLCVNPAGNLANCMLRGRSTILFSATLLPIQYYKKLLGGEPEDYEVYARSVFHPDRRALLVASDVTSKYTRRSEDEYGNIARYIEEIVRNRHGNYMVFCPSYAFLRTVHLRYVDNFGGEGRECILQSESMSEADREAFLDRFRRLKSPEEEDSILIGFCVLGGIFSEGIDLKHDSLIGVMIVGTGLPQVSREKEILKAYFDKNGENGFDYAYRYPGMNKVLQAAGRVIRTAEDVGIIALLDERFLQPAYRRLFPREWGQFETVTVNEAAKRVERFWDQWL